MKKIYIQPSFEVERLNGTTILAGSDLKQGNGTQPTGNQAKSGLFESDWSDDAEEDF